MALIHHWKFDDVAPVTTYQDEVGGKHGTAIGTVTPGVASLPGLGTQVSVPDAVSCIDVSATNIVLAGPYTISFWATLTNFSVHQNLHQAGTTTDYLKVRSTQETRIRYGATTASRWNTAAILETGTNHHFLHTRDSSDNLFLYIDGVLQTNTFVPTNSSPHSIRYIAGSTSGGYSGGGRQDDFRVYDSYTDAAGADAIYQAGLTAPTTGDPRDTTKDTTRDVTRNIAR